MHKLIIQFIADNIHLIKFEEYIEGIKGLYTNEHYIKEIDKLKLVFSTKTFKIENYFTNYNDFILANRA